MDDTLLVRFSLATLVSFAAALVQLGLGFAFSTMASAPGWRRARLFSAMAYSAAAYAMVNVVLSIPHFLPSLRPYALTANYLFGTLHCCAWLVYTFADSERPWESLARRYRIIIYISLVLGVIGMIPGVGTTDQIVEIEVAWLGVTYRQSQTTGFANFISLWLLFTLSLPFVHFIKQWRRGEANAGPRVFAFAVFFACTIEEVLVALGFVPFLYLADVGFMVVVVVVLIEAQKQVTGDAERLKQLGEQLAEQVGDRTRERDQARNALASAERLASLGQLAAGVGHEINNPLTYLRVNIDVLRDAVRRNRLPDDAPLMLEELRSGVDRIARVVADLRAFASPNQKRVPLDVIALVDAAVGLAAVQVRHSATIRRHFYQVENVVGDGGRLSQVIVNLLVNASEAVREAERSQPQIEVRVHMTGEHRLAIEVEDNGTGMSPETLRRVGEPYFTTRPERGGRGLSVFVARGIVETLGGTLEYQSVSGKGTLATVSLPSQIVVVPAPMAQPLTPLPTPLPTRGAPDAPPANAKKRRALVIDDDTRVGRAVARMMFGFEATAVESGQEALDLLAQGREFDVIVCDIMMPGKTGVDVYDELERTRPELLSRIFFMTGGALAPEIAAFLQRPGVRHLMKPFEWSAFEAMLATLPNS